MLFHAHSLGLSTFVSIRTLSLPTFCNPVILQSCNFRILSAILQFCNPAILKGRPEQGAPS
jgi:hypothetical protein